MGSKQEDPDPHALLTKAKLIQALKLDKGSDASLKSFVFDDFTKKGDNYSSFVTGVSVLGEYNSDGVEFEENYVAKLNLCKAISPFRININEMFIREGSFYTEAVRTLNETLKPYNISLDCFPKFVYGDYTPDQEVMITNDLRKKGFRMIDKTNGLNRQETLLTLREVARLHAASFATKCKIGQSYEEIFPYLAENIFAEDTPTSKLFGVMFDNGIDQATKLLSKFGEFENAIKIIQEYKINLKEKFFQFMRGDSDEKFRVILHGDLWVVSHFGVSQS